MMWSMPESSGAGSAAEDGAADAVRSAANGARAVAAAAPASSFLREISTAFF
jgi:hypothetical protein